jgi:hypothetical protein
MGSEHGYLCLEHILFQQMEATGIHHKQIDYLK